MCVRVYMCAQSCSTLCDPHGLQPTRLLCPWHSPGKNTGVGCHFLLLGTFSTQGWNLRLLHLPPVLAGRFFTTSAIWEALSFLIHSIFLTYIYIYTHAHIWYFCWNLIWFNLLSDTLQTLSDNLHNPKREIFLFIRLWVNSDSGG